MPRDEKKVLTSRKKNRALPVLIALLALLSVAANFVIFGDFFTDNFDRPEEDNPTVAGGNTENPFTNQSLDEVLSSVRGRIPILEYHMFLTPRVERDYIRKGLLKLNKKTKRYFISSSDFRSQLERLYAAGFRNISLDEYLSLAKGERKDLDRIPPGSKLYVLTFDDASYGQFDFTGEGKDGEPAIDPDCAVGIMLDFARAHPDFRLNAAFNVEFSSVPFQSSRDVGKKLNMLLDLGFEIVNHTKSHRLLSRFFPLDPQGAAREIGGAMELFESYLGYRAAGINKICYPGGFETPDVWNFVSNVSWRGRSYRYVAALDAEGYQARNPNEDGFNPYCIARIEISGSAFDDFVLNAPDLFRTPTLMERKSNAGMARK